MQELNRNYNKNLTLGGITMYKQNAVKLVLPHDFFPPFGGIGQSYSPVESEKIHQVIGRRHVGETGLFPPD